MSDQIRILVVDDIPETRDHLAKLLGFETDMEVVGAAESGPQALELAQQLNPDVVLMDADRPQRIRSARCRSRQRCSSR